MENPYLAFSLFGFVFWIMWRDLALMKSWNEAIFKESFTLLRHQLWIILAGIVIFSLIPEHPAEGIALVLIAVVIPVFLKCRKRFLRIINGTDFCFSPEDVLTSDAYAVIVYWFLGTGYLTLVLDVIAEIGGRGGEIWNVMLGSVLSMVWMVFLVYQASQKFSDGGFFKDLGFVNPAGGKLKMIVISALLAVFFAYLSVTVILSRGVQPDTPLGRMLKDNLSAEAIMVFLAAALLFAPLAEEMVFRGYFFHVLEKTKGKLWAVVIVALSFAGLHYAQYWGDWAALVLITVLGFALTLLRSWMNTTTASVIMHYVYNTSVALIPVLILVSSHSAYFKYTALYPKLDVQMKEQLLKESVKQDPEFIEPYNELAWLYATENKNLDEAERLINQALKAHPDNPAFLDTKAEVLLKQGRVDESLAISQGLLDQNLPEDLNDLQLKRIKAIEKEMLKAFSP